MSAPPVEVAPGVHRFTDTLANWYAVETRGGVVLVDCGWPRGRAVLVAGLHAVGLAPRDVRAVALTHGHPDHLGNARWLERECGVPVYAHPDELPRVRGERPSTRSPSLVLELWRPRALRFVTASIRRGVLSPRWPLAPRAIDGELDLVPVPTPGHTEGHAAYLLPDRGVVFSGDALVTLDVLTGRRGPRLHPRPFQVDVRQAAASLTAFASLGASLLLPGHGEPYHGAVAAAVERARESARGL